MYIYKVWREDSVGYDEYDSAVVIASDKDEALSLITSSRWGWGNNPKLMITVIGSSLSEESEIVVASFNAG